MFTYFVYSGCRIFYFNINTYFVNIDPRKNKQNKQNLSLSRAIVILGFQIKPI